MTVTEAANRLKSLIGELPEIAERICIAQAQNGLTIVKNRSIADGIFVDSQEGNFAEYSKNKMSTSKFKGKERNQAGAKYISDNPLGTWHEFRKAQGLQSEKVNASYTNRTWTSLAITQTVRTQNGVLVVVSTTDPEVKQRLFELSQRYGNFLNPTAPESVDLKQDSFKDFLLEIKKRL